MQNHGTSALRPRWPGRALLGFSLLAGTCGLDGSAPAADPWNRCVQCPPGVQGDPAHPPSAPPEPAKPDGEKPDGAAQDANQQMTNPDQVFNQDAGQFQAASSTNALTPNMIGDFFGAVGGSGTFYRGGFGHVTSVVPGPTTPLGGRQKIQENGSPLPRDRVYLNYSFFENVPLINGGTNVNRYTLGVEKTFLDGLASFEVRMPMWQTVSSEVHTAPGGMSEDHFEFGNMNFAAKLLLAQTSTYVISGGMAMTLPTANDVQIFSTDTDTELLRYRNESVHFMPFLGYLYTPNDRLFVQTIGQFDFDANGNKVFAKNDLTGQMEYQGKARDASWVFIGTSAGYWIYRNPAGGTIKALAPILELHWSRTMNGPDVVRGVPGGAIFQAGSRFDSIEVTNATFGLQALVGSSSSVSIGYCTPIGNNHDQQFDGELRVLVNLLFGRSANANNRAGRVNGL